MASPGPFYFVPVARRLLRVQNHFVPNPLGRKVLLPILRLRHVKPHSLNGGRARGHEMQDRTTATLAGGNGSTGGDGSGRAGLKALLEDYERSLIREALAATGGHQRRTAARLGLLPTTLHEKMKRLGLLQARGREASLGLEYVGRAAMVAASFGRR